MNPGVQQSPMAESQDTPPVPSREEPAAVEPAGGCEFGVSSEGSAQHVQIERMRSGQLSAVQRVAAGNELARLGDPRFRSDAWDLPNDPLLGFVEIPSGPCCIGSDPGRDPSAYPDELPAHEIILPRYYIGRYPVTGGQFRVFIDQTGHKPENDGSLDGAPNHPVVWLGWSDALKYCEWLTQRLRDWESTPEPLATLLRQEDWCLALPSEPEWEKAARATDGRIYPWGNEPDNNRGNLGGTGIMTTSAVGCFPEGASPYGIEDMSGNVWEWTRSVWGPYPYPSDVAGRAEREYLEVREGVRRVRRGGAFFSSPRSVRCAVRLGSGPYPHGGGMGCRVVLRPALG
jgi:formylglycine-generating enzyme required for sulfatase activity